MTGHEGTEYGNVLVRKLGASSAIPYRGTMTTTLHMLGSLRAQGCHWVGTIWGAELHVHADRGMS